MGVSATILRHAGLDEFVAPDRESFVRLAIDLANDSETPRRLASLRLGLRDRLRASRVCDAERFTRSLESIYRDLWRRYLGRVTGTRSSESGPSGGP